MHQNIPGILQRCFNKIYKLYLEDNDIVTLEILNGLLGVITLKGLSFKEDFENMNLKDTNTGPIIVYNSETIELPENSYFLNLENLIREARINMNLAARDLELEIIKKKKTPKKNKGKSSKKICELSTSELITKHGSQLISGLEVIHLETKVAGTVKGCYVQSNRLVMRVKANTSNLKDTTNWSMKGCKIKDTGQSIEKYIKNKFSVEEAV